MVYSHQRALLDFSEVTALLESESVCVLGLNNSDLE